MAKKEKKIAELIDDAAVLIQKYVKLKASDDNGFCRCVTCGKVDHWKKMDGGHFISRKWTATKLLEENIHPQCKGCNGFLKGNLIEYTRYMDEMYGKEFVDELRILKHQTKKYYRDEIMTLIKELKEKIALEEDRVIG